LKGKMFLSPIAIEFISEFYRIKKNVSLAEISCLFDVLLKSGLICNKKKLFLDFINENFNNPFPNSEIRNSSISENQMDVDRIKEYKLDLKAYIESTRSQKNQST